MKKLIEPVVLLSIATFMVSCSAHKKMVKCPDNQKTYRAAQHKKMVKCPKNQKVPRTIWLFSWQIK